MIVRELLIRLGYEVDENGIRRAEDKMAGLKKFAAGLALGAAVFELGKAAVSTAVEMENLQSSFEVMLGSASKATEFSKSLVDFAAKTPYQLAELSDVANGLLSYDIGVDDTKKYLSQLGDIALGSGEKIKSLGIVLGQVASAGKLRGQDFLQFISAGFNPLNVLAKQQGKTMDEMTQQMGKGQITFDMVAKAMDQATSAGGRFYKGVEKGAQTLSGMWSTVIDTFNLGLGQMVMAFSPFIKRVMAAISSIDFTEFGKFAEYLAAGVDRFVAAFYSSGALVALESLKEGLANLIGVIAFASGAVGESGDVWTELGDILGKFLGYVALLVTGLTYLADIIVFVGGLLGPLAVLFPVLAAGMALIFGVQMLASIFVASGALGVFTGKMWLLNGATIAQTIATARTTLAFIGEALALGDVSLAAGIAKIAMISLATSPMAFFIALGVLLAEVLWALNMIKETEAETANQAEEMEYQRQQGIWGDRRLAVAKDKKMRDELLHQGYTADSAQVKEVDVRLSQEEQLLRTQSRALDAMDAERQKKAGQPQTAADFQATIDMAGKGANATISKMVEGNSKNTKVVNNVGVSVTVPTDQNGQTPLTPGAVKDIATQAIHAAFSIQLQKVMIATL